MPCGRRKVQLTVWALVIFLCDFVLTFGMACRQEGFVWTQMFTDNYEWFGRGGGAADAAVQRAARQRATSSCSTGSTPPMCICCTGILPCL